MHSCSVAQYVLSAVLVTNSKYVIMQFERGREGLLIHIDSTVNYNNHHWPCISAVIEWQ